MWLKAQTPDPKPKPKLHWEKSGHNWMRREQKERSEKGEESLSELFDAIITHNNI